MLAYHKQIDKRATLRNRNRSAALERPAMKLLGGGGGGGGLQLVCGRPTLALNTLTDKRFKIKPIKLSKFAFSAVGLL